MGIRCGCVFFAVLLLFVCAAAAQDTQRSFEERAAELVSKMTLEEKALQMQNSAPAIPRLGIPAYDWWNEALHGVARAGVATVFPQAIGLAATWDKALMRRVAEAISTEARAKYNDAIAHGNHGRYFGLTFWSPNINIFRDPRWGRGQETYGEDPYLAGRLAVEFVQGMQGDDPRYLKTVATPKHYAVHSGPEPLRHSFDARAGEHDLDQTYLAAFRAAVVDGGAYSVMCAYNRVNGTPACANPSLLQEVLRGDWKFKGYVVSDCGAVRDIFRGHEFKPSLAEAAAAAVKAGTDLTCGSEYKALPEAVKAGLLTEADMDRALVRLFTARFKLGMFDPPESVPYASIPYSANDSEENRKLALEAARRSIVLLKNGGVLPLTQRARNIAVIGPAADDPDMLLANYNGTPSRMVTPLEGMERQFAKTARVRFALGATYTAQSTAPAPAAVFGQGLRAEYFDNPDLAGQPKVTRIEPRIYFNWEMRDPAIAGSIPRAAFSARWSGTLKAPYGGEYVLGAKTMPCEECRGRDSIRVFLEDREIVGDNAASDGRQALVKLEAGRSYPLRVEYRQRDSAGAGLELVWRPPAAGLLAEAVEIANISDVVVAFLGLNANLEGEEMRVAIPGFSGGDRTDIGLPAPQEQLLRAAIETGKRVVVVLMSGSALAATYADERAAAVLAAWYPGEEGGTAIAETLAGDNNPAGRLPVTFYRSTDQLPPFADYSMTGRTYRYFRGQPLYPFGHGLSYSRFRYSDLQVRAAGGGGYDISARVQNTSSREGDEVVQVYVSRGSEAPEDPVRELRGFERIRLAAEQAAVVRFHLPPEAAGPKARVSVGGGQPLPGTQFVEAVLPSR
jgi:beta-glucosidase